MKPGFQDLLKVCLVFATISTLPAQARLGETIEECTARYGKPKPFGKDGGTMAFWKNGFIILASFYEAKCDSIIFFKQEKDALGLSGKISEVELNSLLEANGAGRKWVEIPHASVDKRWVTEDGLRGAGYDSIQHSLVVFTTASADRSAARQAAEEKEKLKGF